MVKSKAIKAQLIVSYKDDNDPFLKMDRVIMKAAKTNAAATGYFLPGRERDIVFECHTLAFAKLLAGRITRKCKDVKTFIRKL